MVFLKSNSIRAIQWVEQNQPSQLGQNVRDVQIKPVFLWEAHLAEEAWVKAGEPVRHVLFVHVVELMEVGSGGEAPLHQIQHRNHPYRGETPTERGLHK